MEKSVWRLIDDIEKYEIANEASMRNPATSIEGIALSFLIFCNSILLGFSSVIPGKYSTRPWPAWNIIEERFVEILPFCLGITAFTFISMYLWYMFMKKEKRIRIEYKKLFSSKKRLCIKCNKVFGDGVYICQACNVNTKDINNYIWQE